MSVPVYYRSRPGYLFRVQRMQDDSNAATCYRLRAYRVKMNELSQMDAVAEVAQSVEREAVLDKMRRHQALTTPEQVFEDLWQTLRRELEGLRA